MRERDALDDQLSSLKRIDQTLEDNLTLIELGEAENDEGTVTEAEAELKKLRAEVGRREMEALLSGEADANDCFLEVHAGAGGTESNDWAGMLLRMYVRWAEQHGYKVDWLEESEGEGAGIKSATVQIKGHNAYGWLKSENGVHRLVRISPFDSNKRRHTSFASVDTIAEIEESDGSIVIPPNEFKVDTFRSGGKGGQNVNKVETAVRITHIPTGLVVASQAQRSQHQNRATAMNLLLSRIFAQRVDAEKAEMERFYGEKGSVSWGNQIRSYVFQPYRMVKDLRTGVETSNVQGVMDGDLDAFVNGWLRAGCPAKRMQGVKDDE